MLYIYLYFTSSSYRNKQTLGFKINLTYLGKNIRNKIYKNVFQTKTEDISKKIPDNIRVLQ